MIWYRAIPRSDNDTRFYTGLPSYNIVLCLYHHLEPYLIYMYMYLHYRPSRHGQPTRQLINCQRLLQPIDELFMVLVCLRLNLLEKTLHTVLEILRSSNASTGGYDANHEVRYDT